MENESTNSVRPGAEEPGPGLAGAPAAPGTPWLRRRRKALYLRRRRCEVTGRRARGHQPPRPARRPRPPAFRLGHAGPSGHHPPAPPSPSPRCRPRLAGASGARSLGPRTLPFTRPTPGLGGGGAGAVPGPCSSAGSSRESLSRTRRPSLSPQVAARERARRPWQGKLLN